MNPNNKITMSTHMDGPTLKEAFSFGTRCIELYREPINALNVFPVPDGDTGTNMLLTMRSAMEETDKIASQSVGAMAASIARGALLGARGNSGVILSQFLQGFAKSLENIESSDPTDMAKALVAGSKASYIAVGDPVEGTMLTVMRELSTAAQECSTLPKATITDMLEAAFKQGDKALSKTPLQLPVLREAGVVDAGGQGVLALIKGMLCYLSGGNVEEIDIHISFPEGKDANEIPVINDSYIADIAGESFGYCTQFMIEGENLDLENIRLNLSEFSESVVVIGEPSLVKVHVHTFEPQFAANYGSTLGIISQVQIDNMDTQHEEFVAKNAPLSTPKKLGIISVAHGEGFVKIFDDLGCQGVVRCEKTMNPSTRELLDAANNAGAEHVIILPNNSNVIAAAKQAAAMAPKQISYVPTKTMPEGIAAFLSYNPDQKPEDVIGMMNEAIEQIATLDIATAVRNTTISGVKIQKGQYIALSGQTLQSSGWTLSEVLLNGIVKLGIEEGSLITLYWGGKVSKNAAQDMGETITKAINGIELEVVYGGQPFYHYILSIE